jgi:hypothetical protein
MLVLDKGKGINGNKKRKDNTPDIMYRVLMLSELG